jgi:methylmalonyl-CoA/ethylmalonyl-CoA epimerase
MIGRLNHVAIAVPDLDAAAAQYRDTLGAKVGAPQDEPDHGVTVVFIELPNTKIELLYPLGDNSPIRGFLDKNPSGGIHHICYEVEDILAARDQLQASGRPGAGRWRTEDRRPWQTGAVPASQGFHRHACRTGAGLMGIVTGLVLYAIIWFMTLFVILPLRLQSQDEAGERVAGTPGSAPANPQLARRFLVTSGVAAVVWAVIAAIIIFDLITIDDIDLFTRFGMGEPR